MKENLANLIKLQRIDTKLIEIEEAKGNLPADVERLTREVDSLESSTREKQQQLKEIESELRQLRVIIEDQQEHLKRYQEQLMTVSTNRAYDALMAEIDAAKAKSEESEFRILQLDDDDLRIKDELKSDRLKREETKAKLSRQKALLKMAVEETEQQLSDLEAERVNLVAKINSRYLKTYLKISDAREGHAVASVSRNACGSCYNTLPPQMLMEIRGMNKIITCDSCGVILFWDET